MIRWMKFNAVGLAGVAVQLGVLQLLVKSGVHYLVATALAVEAAVLHNYFWHTRFTWPDRRGSGSIWRFHLANGLISLLGNLALMKMFTGWLGWPVLPANLLSITITSLLNFFAGDRWVFQRKAVRAASRVD
jgi:putative flippase GtrA